MIRILVSVVFVLGVAGCALTPSEPVSEPAPTGATDLAQGQLRPRARPATLDTTARPVPSTARTVDEFDTTTADERAAAIQTTTQEGGETALGTTVATLGSPTEPGFWLKTPLVDSPAKGRVDYTATGKSVTVDLIPIDGPKTAGSRMSLAALRLIEAPLTGLPEITVFRLN